MEVSDFRRYVLRVGAWRVRSAFRYLSVVERVVKAKASR